MFSQRQPSIVRTLLARVLLLVADHLALPLARVLLPYTSVAQGDSACVVPSTNPIHSSLDAYEMQGTFVRVGHASVLPVDTLYHIFVCT